MKTIFKLVFTASAVLGAATILAAQELSPSFTTLFTFSGEPNGATPNGLVLGSGGVLYGTTATGGSGNCGTIYSLSPAAYGAWNYEVLYSAPATPQPCPSPSGLAVGQNGVLYSLAAAGGANGAGQVFSLTPPSFPSGAWTYARLYDFAGAADGKFPIALTTFGGVVYGATSAGGDSNNGVVFALTPSAAGSWSQSVLHNLETGSPGGGGAHPYGLVAGASGVLIGSSQTGGKSNLGSIYSLTPPVSPGGGWSYRELYSFSGGGDAALPTGILIGRSSIIYGSSIAGGTGKCLPLGCGAIFSLAPPATPGGVWTESVLYSFTGGNDGASPLGAMAMDNGQLFGMAIGEGKSGQLFMLNPPAGPGAAWTKTMLFHFTYCPTPGIVLNGGALFGSVYGGGAFADGYVFQLTL